MPIIGNVGRRSKQVRILNICIHCILLIGAVTMIYPFLIMLSGSIKSDLDFKYFNIIPKYFSDETTLFQKHLSSKYNGRLSLANDCLGEQLTSFEDIKSPKSFPDQRVKDWEIFLAVQESTRKNSAASQVKLPWTTALKYSPKGSENSFPGSKKVTVKQYCPKRGCMTSEGSNFLETGSREMDHYYYGLGAVSESGVQPEMQRGIKTWLKKQYQNDLDRLNDDLGTKLLSWEEIGFSPEDFTLRRSTGDYRGIMARFQEFKEDEAPQLYHYYFSLDGAFISKLRRKYAGKLEELNKDLNTDFQNWRDIHLSQTKPAGVIGQLWGKYVKKDLNLQFIGVEEQAKTAYQEFLKTKYRQDIKFLNKIYSTEYINFNQIPLVKKVPSRGNVLVDWAEFVESHIPVESLYIRSAEFYYRDWLREKYNTLSALTKAHAADYKNFETVNMPAKEYEWTLFKANKKHILWEFITRNYIVVIDTLLYNGRSIWNTFVYCSLSILAALIINPMAAYALSRYRPPSTYKILLFLMLTMAFPPMVLGIPRFLMMKNLGLLNTYAA
ncbi:MAG: carbohydrate ABC transporter permease, partial [Candidatus Omnitrophica bacterium]|nr:carbohydrate ABC transporter permease [Candidatus Omnitrophota bacterium]